MSLAPIVRLYQSQIDDIKVGERAVIARIGGNSVDRHRTIISPNGIDLEPYRRSPVVMWFHGQDAVRGHVPIGKNKWIKTDGDRLIAKTIFRDNDEFADNLFRAYQDGYINGWSISVLSHDASPPTREEIRANPALGDGCDMIYRRTELTEYSATPIPSHREAVSLLVSRGILIPEGARADMELSDRGRTAVSVPIDLPRTATESVGGLAGGGATVKPDDDAVERHVVEEGGKWYVYNHDKTKRLDGPFESKQAADHRLGEIEAFKHEDKEKERSAPDVVAVEPAADRAVPEAEVARDADMGDDSDDAVVERDGQFYGVCRKPGCPGGPHSSRKEAMAHDCERASPGAPPVMPSSFEGGTERTSDDAVQFDGHGGWTVRDMPASRFSDEATARGVLADLERLRASPPPMLSDVVRLELLRFRGWAADRKAEQQAQRDLYERGVV